MISEKEQSTDFFAFLDFFRKHIKTISVYTFIGAILGFSVTFFIPKEYKSHGVVYPPSSTSIDNSIEFPNFGYDLEADRLIQILQSSEIRDSVIRKFDLASHFKINKNDPAWLESLNKKYFNKITFERSASMSVQISAKTKDPYLSSDVVNYIIYSSEALREKIYKKNIVSAFETAKNDYEAQKKRVDSAEVLLVEKLKQNKLSSLLMLLADAQISIDIDKLSSSGLPASQSTIGAELIAFKSMYDVLKEYKARYIKIKKSYTNPIPKLFVINSAEPNLKKVSPSFSINTVVAALFAFFVSVVVLFARHNYVRK